jgi:hypothetical protein
MGFILNNKVSQAGDGNGGFLNLNVSSGATDSLVQNLKAWYTLNNTLADNSGNGNNFESLDSGGNGVFEYINGGINIIKTVNGYQQGAFNTINPVINNTQDYTICGWALSQANVNRSSGDVFVNYFGDSGGGNQNYGTSVGAYIPNRGTIQWSIGNNAGDTGRYVILPDAGVSNNLSFVVSTYTSSSRTLYAKAFYSTASPNVTSQIISNPSNDEASFGIGNSSWQGVSQSSYPLVIKSVGAWDRVLTQNEMTRLYNNGTPINYNPTTGTFN